MILYFSGTGNSEYVAKRISQEIDDDIMQLFDKIKNHDFSDVYSQRPWVIVAPTYAWRIPRIVQNWLEKTKLVGNQDIYFVMTCGDNIGNANHYLKDLCISKKMNNCGCAQIVMPENYIAMFKTPSQEEALQIIEQAESVIDDVAHYMKEGQSFPTSKQTLKGRISSGLVNELFYPLFVHAKKFYATDACISCHKCVKVCPLNNIHIEKGKPVWGKHCTHCMACLCRCPQEAIEYGRHSRGLPRYTCQKAISDK